MSDQPMPDDATPLPDHEPAPSHEDELPCGERDTPPDRGATLLI